MTTVAFIIGMIILGVLTLVSAFVIAGAITNASGKGGSAESDAPVLRQPEMKYFNDYDTADYLGISVSELAEMRKAGLLDGVFATLLSSETEYDESRYIYSRELLDKRMNDMMKDGKTIDIR